MNNFKKIALSTAIATSLFAGQAFAADQGTLGSASTGKSVVSLSVNDQVQISGVDDISLGAFDGSNDLTGSTEFCVYRSGGDAYQMTVSAEGKTTLEVASVITGDNDASNGADIAHGGTSASFTGSNLLDCNSNDNAALEVTFAAADLRTATSAADYTATVLILVEPI